MTNRSSESPPAAAPVEEDGFDDAPPASPWEPDFADEETEMRRWTEEAFAPAPATPGRRPLFRN
jgi:hypothetical protein